MKGIETQDELALVCIARKGDKEALQTLLSRHWTWVRGVVYSILADGQEVDDVMQEICLRVITRIHTLREPERFRGWLAVLARRIALRHRQRRRHGAAELAALSSLAAAGSYAGDPADDIERRELCGRVLEAVRRLPEKYREVFVLAHSGGLTYAQIAEILDVPVTTMQIRLVRARRAVRDQIAEKSKHKVHEK